MAPVQIKKLLFRWKTHTKHIKQHAVRLFCRIANVIHFNENRIMYLKKI